MNRIYLSTGRAFAAVALCAAAASGEEPSLAPRAGVVLLHNGELIAGEVIEAGDRYDVRLKSGQISLRRRDVAMVCRDAAECYRHKRAAIESGRPRDHLELAQWCIKHDLLEAAEQELSAARAIDARHPRIPLVESRLALARHPLKSEPAASPKNVPAPQTPDDALGLLPEGTMATFTNTVQPLLLNYCTGSGCHSARAPGGLKLERIHRRISGRFTTQRNLRRVLNLLDREHPPQSKLLQAPIRPHGNAETPIFTSRERSQYRQLVLWVLAVTNGQQKSVEPSLAERTAQTGSRAESAAAEPAQAPPSGTSVRTVSAESELPPRSEPDGSRIPASSADEAFTRDELRAMGMWPESGSQAQKLQYGADLKPDFVPKDPFDPEVFNRRFFRR